MAFSVLQQYPNFVDLQTCFDTFPLQRTINDCLGLLDPDPMEHNASSTDNNGVHHHQPIINSNNSRSNSSSHSDNIEGSDVASSNNHFITTNTTESINQTTIRSCLGGGFHHQSLSNDYEQVINFVDSPPNSEGSWQDEQSKASPGPQIIEVQTIYSNSGARKRRMDWDSLDIGQNGSTTTVHTVDIANNKIAHLSGNTISSSATAAVQQQHHEKEKHKKDKLPSGRGSWADDIEFDLNAEFNSNSYLNNETFLTFSTTLTVPKQEPQTELPKENKSAIVCVASVAEATKEADGVSCDEQKPEQSAIGDKEEDVAAFASPRPQHGPTVETAAATSLSDEHKFQYILAAATSIATKNNEEALTYLNQGQSYEIKLKKTGDLSFYRDKILKSVIKICFHERRLQYMEREQMQQWKASRPGERIIEVDVPLSYGLCHVAQPLTPSFLNTVEVFWDPLKEVGVYVKVNCISTEFTPRKHGGEKGVPFKLQIETYIENTNTAAAVSPTTIIAATAAPLSPTPAAAAAPVTSAPAASPPTFPANFGSAYNNVGALRPTQAAGKQPVHAAACQIKVFKLKGADRKHKQDREKIQKRSQSEQEKFQPSYECTIMNDMPLDVVAPTSGRYSPEFMKVWPNSPVHIPKYDGTLAYASASPPSNSSPIAINSVTSSNSPTLKMMDPNLVSSQQGPNDVDDNAMNIMPETTPAQVSQWLTYHRLTPYLSTFAHFSGADIMRMSKDDLIQICGLADGIRMYNILRAKAIAPRLTLYLSTDGNNFSAIYLLTNTAKELSQKIYKVPGLYDVLTNGSSLTMNGSVENAIVYNSWGGMHSKYSNSGTNIFSDVARASIYVSGPSGVHVNVTDEVLTNEIKDGSLYALEVQNDKVIMKLINK